MIIYLLNYYEFKMRRIEWLLYIEINEISYTTYYLNILTIGEIGIIGDKPNYNRGIKALIYLST